MSETKRHLEARTTLYLLLKDALIGEADRRDDDWAEKTARYQASGIHEVVRFDPDGKEPAIRVWDRIKGDLIERDATNPNLRECQALRLWWVVVPSMYGPILRLAREPDGTGLLPTAKEERTRLEGALTDERKARAVAEHEKMLAEHEKMLAEQRARDETHAREEAERARAEVEADNDRLRAELERLRHENERR